MKTQSTEVSRETKILGQWWLPENPDGKLKGTLILDGDRSELKLEGKLLDSVEHKKASAEIILGIAEDRTTQYTLESCDVYIGKGFALDETYYISTIYPENVYALAHFESKEQAHFSEYHMQIENLLQWTWKRGIDITRNPSGLVVSYVKPDAIRLFESKEFNVSISFADNPTEGFGRNSVSLEEHCTLDVLFKDTSHVESVADILNYIVRFFTFACDCQMYSNVVYSKKAVLDGREPHLGIVRIRSKKLNTGISESFREYESLFSLKNPKLEPQVMNCFRAWIQKRGLIQPVIDLYLSTIYKSEMYLENLCLNVAYALEAYHRAFLDKNIVGKNEFEPIHKQLIKALPGLTNNLDIQRSLEDRTRYSYEKSLRDKLIDLLGLLPDHYVLSYIGETVAEFAKRCKDVRNELTHPDPTKPRNRTEFADRAGYAYHRMRFLLQYLLLRELEMDQEAIDYFLIEYINWNCPFIIVNLKSKA
jgi:hypothetical protein